MSISQLLLLGVCGLLPAAGTRFAVQQSQQAPGNPKQQTSAENSVTDAVAIGDEERSAVTFTGYDLTLHLEPQAATFSAVARVVVRNDGHAPLSQIALQISSSLHWDAASQTQSGRTEKLAFNQHLLQTDADRTGQASEAVIRLASPLKPQGSAELTLLYSGSTRSSSDSDVPAPEVTLFRGFGDSLWYPVASPQVFAGEGASLLHAVGQQMLRQASASVRLRLSVEYTGEAPGMAFLCGSEQPLIANTDDADAPVAVNPGVATAEFAVRRLGFRPLSLAITGKTVPVSGGIVAVAPVDDGAAERIASLSTPIVRILSEWIGGSQARTLNVVDRPGTPFAEETLLILPVAHAEDSTLVAMLVSSLTHARFRSEQVWLDQGMADFLSLIWLERTEGRPAALRILEEQSHALALAESVPRLDASGGLLTASDAIEYRTKASSVLWQLRNIAGDDALKQMLQRYGRERTLDQDPKGFERLLEQVSGKSLGWFFDDWVYHDRGLPDLSIVSVAPRELAAKDTAGAGWLVAVEVRNDGGAVAEVPVTVRSGALTATERLRIGAHATASIRIVFQGVPEQVQVNDGTVPEMIASTHIRDITVR